MFLILLAGFIAAGLWAAWRIGTVPEEERLAAIGQVLARVAGLYLLYAMAAVLLFALLSTSFVGG